MESLQATTNQSKPLLRVTSLPDAAWLVSDRHREIITLVNYVFICGVISLFGAISNVINLVIFYKQGLNTTINISFFSLAISDLCSLVIQQWFNICVIPYFESSGVPFIFNDVQYMSGGIPRETFARITCLITVYITAERCLCIAFPLHIKQIITSKTSTIVIVSMYLGTWVTSVPFYVTSGLGWKFFPERNKTLLALKMTLYSEKTQGILYIAHAILATVSFLAVVVFTLILIHKLSQKSEWLTTDKSQSKKITTMSHRDKATIKMVVLIAVILIICYIPAVVLCVATFYEPEFSVGGKYYNVFYILWSVAVFFENINSSVNIFLYLKMSTKYRKCFKEIFFVCDTTHSTS